MNRRYYFQSLGMIALFVSMILSSLIHVTPTVAGSKGSLRLASQEELDGIANEVYQLLRSKLDFFFEGVPETAQGVLVSFDAKIGGGAIYLGEETIMIHGRSEGQISNISVRKSFGYTLMGSPMRVIMDMGEDSEIVMRHGEKFLRQKGRWWVTIDKPLVIAALKDESCQ
ncbi:unnamed protein product, partial [marine sediment metagenome]